MDKKGKLSYALLSINTLPLIAFAVVILLMGTYLFTSAMNDEVEVELSNVSNSLKTTLDMLYPGDYRLVGESSFQFYKGDTNLTGNYDLVDRIKSDTDLDITVFFMDTRILTTIRDQNGSRIVGSGAPESVVNAVLATGEPRFYDNAMIYGTSSFSYYSPLKNMDGSVVGMLFVGKPSRKIDQAVEDAILPLMIADIALVVLVSVFTFLYTKRIVSSLLQIHRFLGQVSTGDLSAKLPSNVLGRSDELGGIAQAAVSMQHSLHILIDQDALTTLLNRRSGDQKLRQIITDSFANKKPFCISIGDIDFFKKVNDTYGHDCGDLILKNVAAKLKTHMRGKGIVARWGGEEFLLIFENMDLEQAHAVLEELLNDIRNMESEYDDQIIRVTMTFGLAPGETDNVTELLRIADEKLYDGKTNGRNRIVL